MLTYLAIFLSISVLLGVFFHRFFALRKGQEFKEEVLDEEALLSEELKKAKVSRNEASEAAQLCERGCNLVKIGKDDEALKCFVKSLSLDPNSMETKYHLGMLYLSKEMYSAAGALFKELSLLDNDAVHFSHLAFCLYKQSDYEAAGDYYKQAILIDDSRPQRFVSLCQVYREMGRPYHALMAVDKAVNLNVEDFSVLLLAADLLLEVKRPEEALAIVEEVLQADPENVEAKEMRKVAKGLLAN